MNIMMGKGDSNEMKKSKKFVVIFALIVVSLFGHVIYASEITTTSSNVKVETVTKDDKKVEILTSEDGYVRITQPTKVKTFTFDSKMNIMGETNKGTNIAIEVYNTKLDKDNISLPKDPVLYKLNTVGVTETFNQLIELLEGENRIVLTYTNEKDKINKGKMVFIVTRESEETKERLKITNLYPQLGK